MPRDGPARDDDHLTLQQEARSHAPLAFKWRPDSGRLRLDRASEARAQGLLLAFSWTVVGARVENVGALRIRCVRDTRFLQLLLGLFPELEMLAIRTSGGVPKFVGEMSHLVFKIIACQGYLRLADQRGLMSHPRGLPNSAAVKPGKLSSVVPLSTMAGYSFAEITRKRNNDFADEPVDIVGISFAATPSIASCRGSSRLTASW